MHGNLAAVIIARHKSSAFITQPCPKPRYYPEYRALARVHSRAEDCETAMSRGVAIIAVPRLRSFLAAHGDESRYLRAVAQVSCRRSGWHLVKAWKPRVGTRAKARCSVVGL